MKVGSYNTVAPLNVILRKWKRREILPSTKNFEQCTLFIFCSFFCSFFLEGNVGRNMDLYCFVHSDGQFSYMLMEVEDTKLGNGGQGNLEKR